MATTYTYYPDGSVKSVTETDDANVNPWNQIRTLYTPDGTAVGQSIWYDSGQLAQFVYDNSSDPISETATIRDAKGDITAIRKTFDDGTQKLTVFDVYNDRDWVQVDRTFDAKGIMVSETYLNDDGSRQETIIFNRQYVSSDNFDSVFNVSRYNADGELESIHHFNEVTDDRVLYTFDTTGELDWSHKETHPNQFWVDYELFHLRDGGSRIVLFDHGYKHEWDEKVTTRDAFGRITSQEIFFDDGSYGVLTFDVDNQEDWYWESKFYSFGGELKSVLLLNDDGQRARTEFPVNEDPGTRDFVDDQGRVYKTEYYRYNGDKLVQTALKEYDVDDQFDWSSRQLDYGYHSFGEHIVIYREITEFDDGTSLQTIHNYDSINRFSADYYFDAAGNLVEAADWRGEVLNSRAIYQPDLEVYTLIEAGEVLSVRTVVPGESVTTRFDTWQKGSRSFSEEFFSGATQTRWSKTTNDDNSFSTSRNWQTDDGTEVSQTLYYDFQGQVTSGYTRLNPETGYTQEVYQTLDVMNESNWASFTETYSGGRLDKLVSVFDNGSKRVVDYDELDVYAGGVAEIISWYDPSGTLFYQKTIYDDGTSSVKDLSAEASESSAVSEPVVDLISEIPDSRDFASETCSGHSDWLYEIA